MELTPTLRKEYEDLYSTVTILPNRAGTMAWYVSRIQKGQSRYEAVSKATGVPWHVVACIHAMEASFDFSCHLHNGDPLTGHTVQVPAGRPKTHKPPFTWEESAIDALSYDGALDVKDWSIGSMLFFLERYNGWGYRKGSGKDTTPPMRSPYLWSFTNHYAKGKYTADGKFNPNVVSEQAGCCAILRSLEESGLINLGSPVVTGVPKQAEKTPADVGWFNAYLFKTPKIDEFSIGIAAKIAGSDETYATMKMDIPKVFIETFMAQFPNAKSVAIAEPTKPWPEVEDKPEPPKGFTMLNALNFAIKECEQDISWRMNGKAKKYTKKFEPIFGTGRYSWCAAFVTWCCEQAGLPMPIKVPGDAKGFTFALVEAWQQWAIRQKFWIEGGEKVKAVSGDIVVFDWDNATHPDQAEDWEDHIGFVIKDEGSSVLCAEGNVDDRTAKKSRPKTLIQGYIRIPNGYKF